MAILGLFLMSLVYVLLVWWLSSAVDGDGERKHNSFWWVFFLGVIGAVIATLLEIRDK